MRRLALLALLALPAVADDAFRGPTREIRDAGGQVSITVPERWVEQPLVEGQLLHLYGKEVGGHDLIVVREAGQKERDRQRERYIAYDTGKYPGVLIQKRETPYFGYRMDLPETKRTVIRAFVNDDPDGLVVTVTSRLEGYDRYWAQQIEAILASVKAGGAGTPAGEEKPRGETRRLYDRHRRLSLVAPSDWKPVEQEIPEEWVCLSPRGASGGPRIAVVAWGGPSNASLVLTTIYAKWSKLYSGASLELVSQNPPAMLVKNRKPGFIEYLVGLDDGTDGYTLTLTVREGDFESYRKAAETMAATVAFEGAPYRAPSPPASDIEKPARKLAVVHGASTQAATVDAVLQALAIFEKAWKPIAPSLDSKADPLRVLVVAPEAFAEASTHFGEPPAVYDPLAHRVVVVPPPPGEESVIWRGLLLSAVTENALHRDLPVRLPAWHRKGLAACMEAAGRSGGSAEEPNPVLIDTLRGLAADGKLVPWRELAACDEEQFAAAETPALRACAWGYVHLMLFGKGAVPLQYKAYAKALVAARGKTPAYDPRTARMEEELKAHVERAFAAVK